MEGEPEEPDEDVRVEEQHTVLWEKCIQQRIFVDLSEDESLHLSDLEGSLALHLSQEESAASEASIHLSGSLGLGDVTSSESSAVSNQSERVVESRTKSSMLHVSAQRPNTIQDEQEDQAQDTSDEDQEDLPYDGDLGSPYFNQTVNSEGDTSSDGRETVHPSPEGPGLSQEEPPAATKHSNHVDIPKPSVVAPLSHCPSDFNQLLLRHFSEEELLRPGRLIEAETLPEVSLLESVDDTIAPTHNSRTNSNRSESSACNSEIHQSLRSDRIEEMSTTKHSDLEEEAEIDRTTSDGIKSSSSIHSEHGASAAVAQEKTEEDDLVQRIPLVQTGSFSEMKYGQGQVHYPLPDFSKVAPKVKIPKTPNGPSRPVPQSTMHRAQSSPGMLDLINRVLSDSIPPPEKPYVFKDKDPECPPTLVHHLQAEYDKLLTKYAEAENRIDQMRTGTNAQPSSDLLLYLDLDDNEHQGNSMEGGHLGSVAPCLPPSDTSPCLTSDIMTGQRSPTLSTCYAEPNSSEKRGTTPPSNIKETNTTSSSCPEDGPSDGDIMTAELTDIIGQFMQKVEELKSIVSNMSVSTVEQQTMLRSMMEAQDQLEREYIRKKDQHRALEMQNYLGLSRKTGAFDPNRQVEGDIFRMGMHLEDIKEMIDKNVCEQISPPHSSSTPTPINESPVCMPTPSPSPPVHEGQSAAFSTVGCMMDTRKKEEEGVEEDGDVHEDSELMTSDSILHSRFSSRSRSSLASLEGLKIQTPGGEEEERSSVSSEVVDDGNILAYLRGRSSSSRQSQRTPDSHSSSNSVKPLGDNNSSVSQRIVNPETDSGFGSSYLNQSASGSFQANLLTESYSVPHRNEAISSSDSEGSCSNLQTAIHSASLASQQWNSPHPSVHTQPCGVTAAAAERWVESTTQEPSVRLQGSERSLRHHVSDPVLSTTMGTERRGSSLRSCSCNSEALQALQSEVSRLKKDLEEGLVQLPHLAQKMDYLTSKYRQDRQERISKTRPRTHHRLACNSVRKPSSGTHNVSDLSSSQTKIEDWISLDMDPSRSKDTDTSGSEIMLQFHSTPVRSRRGSVCSIPELHASTNRGSEGYGSVQTSGVTGSLLTGGTASDKRRPQTTTESFYSRESWSVFSSPSLQRPLLQVSYASSSSLPASYKVMEPPLQPMPHHRKRSTQSDTALLPSNVYFLRTPSPGPSRTGRCRGSKEVEMNRTLDQAIEVARSMKRTTDRMAKRLSTDLAKAHSHRKQLSVQPQGGRKHHHTKQSADQFTL